jgi:hypothetical protein
MRRYLYMHEYIHTYVCIYIHIYIYNYAFMYIHVHIYEHISMFIYTHPAGFFLHCKSSRITNILYVYTYTHIYTYSYTHLAGFFLHSKSGRIASIFVWRPRVCSFVGIVTTAHSSSIVIRIFTVNVDYICKG